MSDTRTVEVFTAGCPLCDEVVELVESMVCASCDVQVVSVQEDAGAERAGEVGIRTVPAVTVNGSLVDCCQGRGVDEQELRAAGVGTPL